MPKKTIKKSVSAKSKVSAKSSSAKKTVAAKPTSTKKKSAAAKASSAKKPVAPKKPKSTKKASTTVKKSATSKTSLKKTDRKSPSSKSSTSKKTSSTKKPSTVDKKTKSKANVSQSSAKTLKNKKAVSSAKTTKKTTKTTKTTSKVKATKVATSKTKTKSPGSKKVLKSAGSTSSVAKKSKLKSAIEKNPVAEETPVKRKRGRPRKADSVSANSELMQRGIRRFGSYGRDGIPATRYVWSAETGEHLATTNSVKIDESAAELSSSLINKVEFSKGDQIVYPAHGLGIVEAIQQRSTGDATQKFYMISIIETGMKIMVPVGQADTVGLRRVVDTGTVDRVYAILRDKDVAIDNQTWNRRYREYSQKIKTGSVLEIASVIRDLTVLKLEKDLSFNERRMLDTAQGLLIKELSIAKSASEDLIKSELEAICDA